MWVTDASLIVCKLCMHCSARESSKKFGGHFHDLLTSIDQSDLIAFICPLTGRANASSATEAFILHFKY